VHHIAQQIITDINDGKCIKEIGLQCVVESRVVTAGMLMHKNQLGRDNWAQERSNHNERIINIYTNTINSRKARPSNCSSSAIHDTSQTS